MKLLLDTNVLLWALTNPGRLSSITRRAIEDDANRVYVSVVSAWEISIKTSTGKLPALADLEPQLTAMRFDLLPISLAHAKATESLPYHHRDPFDRMLIAQAQAEELTLVSSDREMRDYEVALLAPI